MTVNSKVFTKSDKALTVCPDCDLLLQHDVLTDRHQISCPRCGAKIERYDSEFINKSMAYSLAGLLFYIPANFMPILTFDVFGLDSNNTMLNGVLQLFSEGYYWMSGLVLLCSVVLPFLYLFLVFSCCLLMTFQQTQYLATLLVWQQKIKEWAMLDVYLLSILIAYIKMGDMGRIATDIGMYCFVGLLITFILTQMTFSTKSAFDILDGVNERKVIKS